MCGRVDHTMIAFEGKLFVFAGVNKQAIMNDLYSIDVTSREVRNVIGDGDIPTSRFGHSSVLYKSSM